MNISRKQVIIGGVILLVTALGAWSYIAKKRKAKKANVTMLKD